MQVGVTALGAKHPLLAGRLFDVCLVDEAGQTPLPAVLGPLLKACPSMQWIMHLAVGRIRCVLSSPAVSSPAAVLHA